MDWQQIFPTYAVVINSKNNSVVTSFGESPADYATLNVKNVVSVNHRGFIKLSGPDSEKFLQGQVTCDLTQLDTQSSLNGAHLTPKGRIIFLFSITRDSQGALLLETNPSVIELAMASFKKYSVFFKTEITEVTDQFVSVLVSGPNADTIINKIDADTSRLIDIDTYSLSIRAERTQACLSKVSGELIPAGQGYSDLLRIRSGTADVTAESSDSFIVQMINLDAQNYISFKKGCYTGQEIVARAHYRGTVKRRMYILNLATSTLPAIGEGLINSDGKVIGNVTNVALASDKTIEILAILAIKSADSTQVKFADLDFIDLTQRPLPYEIIERS
ncbi:MAG: hypothetical protein OSB13_03475 [Porticoccaceae bacterium]|nr:hypothetical protein [Porticoccaceae bacterium]